MKSLNSYSNYYIDISTTLPPLISSQIFNNSFEIWMEIGFGEGEFLIELARSKDNINFVGLEIKKHRFMKALHKSSQLNLKNIKFLHIDATVAIEQLFLPSSISKIYINFPDPWPKLRHNKHRIFNELFLNQINKLLENSGILEIASDHKEYIKNIMCVISKLTNYRLQSQLLRAGNSGNISRPLTKFEKKFIEDRRYINYLRFIKH